MMLFSQNASARRLAGAISPAIVGKNANSRGKTVKNRLGVCAAVLLATTSLASSGATVQDFRYPRGDAGATRYSPLTQINAKNVGHLKQAWRYDLKPDSELQDTPIVVDGVLYGVGSGKVVAL